MTKRGKNDDADPTRPASRGDDRQAFLLRLNPALLEELRRWAAAEFRSLNAQIEYLLAEQVRRRRKGSS